MDIFAHGLWTAAAAKSLSRPSRRLRTGWAAFFGVAPDLFSFGIYTAGAVFGLTRIPFEYHAEPVQYAGLVPAYIQTLYHYTHSFIIFAIVFGLVWLIRRRPFWELGGWGLHILIDIPTHSSRFFPTPFLWPISDFTVNGISWGNPWFMAVNYSALLLVWIWIWRKKTFMDASG